MASLAARLLDAETAYEAAVETHGAESLEVVRACGDLGELHCDAGDVQQARIRLEEAVRIFDEPGGELAHSSSCLDARILEALAFVYGVLGQADKEREAIQRCLHARKQFSVKDAISASLLLSFGGQREDKKNLPLLERLYEPLKSVKSCEHEHTSLTNGISEADAGSWHPELSKNLQLSNKGLSVIYGPGAGKEGRAIGCAELKGHEERAFRVTVERSLPDEGGILIGIMDASAIDDAGKQKTWAWGFDPANGKVYAVSGPKGKSSELVDIGCAASGRAGTTVVAISMKLQTLCFAINGDPPVQSGVKLPAKVRLWAQLRLEATLTLSASSGLGKRGIENGNAVAHPQAALPAQKPGWDPELSSDLEIHEDGLGISLPGNSSGKGVAVGKILMQGQEEHAFTLTIEKSLYNEGGGILIGLIDASAVGDAQRSDVWAWGYYPGDGQIYEVTGPRAKLNKVSNEKLGRNGKAGTTVQVIVNMKEQALYFSIDGAEPVQADVKLPKVVRPWVQVSWEATLVWSEYEGPDQRKAQRPKPDPADRGAEAKAVAAKTAEAEKTLVAKARAKAEGILDNGHSENGSSATSLRLHTLLVSLCGMIMCGTTADRLALEGAAVRGPEEDSIARFFWAVMASNGFNKVGGRRSLQPDYATQALETLEQLHGVLVDKAISDLDKVKRLIASASERHGAKSLQAAQWLALHAGLCRANGDYEQVRESLLQVLHIQEREFGFDSIYITWTLRGLAHAEGKLGDLNRKWELLHRAAELEEDELGSDHIQTRTTRYYLQAVEERRRHLRDPDGTLELTRLFPRRQPATKINRHTGEATADVEDHIVADPWKPFLMAASGGGSCDMPVAGSGIPIPFYCSPG